MERMILSWLLKRAILRNKSQIEDMVCEYGKSTATCFYSVQSKYRTQNLLRGHANASIRGFAYELTRLLIESTSHDR